MLVAVLGFWALGTEAQELVPRAYWPAPKGTQVLVLGYQYSTGDIISDPTLPVVGVESDIHYAQVSYQHTLSLFDRTANIQFNQPYMWSTTEGIVENEYRRRDISDMADTRILLSVNLRGAPTMDAAGFGALRANPKTIVGASVLVQAPTGDYDSDKVLNAGTNRWAVKPAMGVIWPVRPDLLFEAHFGAWFFGDNDDFVGMKREQDPIVSTEVYLIKRISPGFWASLDLNYYFGGRTTVDNVERGDLQRNSRIGVTAVFPIKGRHAIRTSYSTGIVTDSGGDYDTVTISYLHAW